MSDAHSSCGCFQDWSFVFKDWKYADKRHKWKENVQKNAQFPFCRQTIAFPHEIVFRGIQPCFLHSGSEGLVCFEPTYRQRGFWRNLRYISVLYGQGKVLFFYKGIFIYKGFMQVFYILTLVWKKNHKMCIWNWFFCHVHSRFNFRERIHDPVSVTRISF